MITVILDKTGATHINIKLDKEQCKNLKEALDEYIDEFGLKQNELVDDLATMLEAMLPQLV